MLGLVVLFLDTCLQLGVLIHESERVPAEFIFSKYRV